MNNKAITKRLFQYLTMFTLCAMLLHTNVAYAQPATISIPVGIGRPCGGAASTDSLKYFNYNPATNLLTHRSICRPNLNITGNFTTSLSSITFNPFDGYLYFTQIRSVSGIYNSYTFRWLPTTCPNLATVPAGLPIYRTFLNQFVAGVEFDPATGLAYQLNFVDTTGIPGTPADEAGTVGQYSSSTIVNGFPAISYFDATNGDLKYVRANDANGVTWGTPVVVANPGGITVGQYTSLKVINGNPAIAYYDVTTADLKYVRATDANGTTWGTAVTPDGTGNAGQFASLEVVSGNPAIAYYNVTNTELRYVRASDANGATWAASASVDGSGAPAVGQYASLKVVNGFPAISYYDATNGDLKYIRATNATGTAWSAALVPDANTAGQYSSMEIVNGNPAIAYYNSGGNTELRYVRASNADGSAWPASVSVDGSGAPNIGQYASLQIVNGNPAIAYYNVTATDLSYIRSNDVNGAAWGPARVVEASGNNTGQYASMVIANGNPGIAYFDATNNDVKFIRSRDNNGTVWYYNSQVYNMELQEVNFSTGTLGALKPINFGGKYIYRQTGDIVLTPSGQMLCIYNNKYFTINWRDYNTATPLVATYIDTVNVGLHNLVGLAYSGGELVGSSKTSNPNPLTCQYNEVSILNGALSPATVGSSSNFSSADMTNIPCGIGAAKRLVAANPVSAGVYNVTYELVIRNYGGTPISNIQVYDTLNMINGVANNISASITAFTAPGGISQNPTYNGKTAGNFGLLAPGGTLSNIPGQNTITIQITCQVSGILPGVVYNNRAAVSGSTIFGDAVRDLSTNGTNPDLNSNDKPDDTGEDQPTPFLVSVAAQTPPCASLSSVLYSQDFSTGTGLSTTIPAATLGSGVTAGITTTGYTGSTTAPIATERYTVTNNASSADGGHFISLTDHTGNTNGQMLIVNADASNDVMYRGGFTYPMCANQQYSVSFYAAFLGNPSYETICNSFGGFRYPKLKIRILDGSTGLIITEISTADIYSTSWQHLGVKFVSPASYSSIRFEIVNDALGGCGNDIAIDDIAFGSCDPIPSVTANAAAGCIGGAANFSSALSDPNALPGSKDYQWQVATAPGGPWTNISGANAATYTIPSVAAGDIGKYYRLLVAATGNLNSVTLACTFVSPAFILNAQTTSSAAATADKNKNNICAGISVGLSLTGGSLGSGATWNWYESACSGTAIGTGTTLNVLPSVTTTYYVRAEGYCNTTVCRPVTVFISCDIDKDKDGIPDYVESYMSAALADANANGTVDAFDNALGGYVDYNNDHINDNFQADGDSDNDGIPNYQDTNFPGRIDSNGDGVDDRFDMDLDGIINMLDLDSDNDGIPDVVEAGGVDVNGDGRIDNFTDTDNDGLSQNVDVNNTGARISGTGLGLSDLDGDGRPNAIDRDSDGDGIPDVVEAGGADANNNAIIDGFVDANNDGLHDSYINATGLLRTGADAGTDGRADSYPFKNFDNDGRANPYDLDSDGDGIVDVKEAGFADTNFNGFEDAATGIGSDGWSNTIRAGASLALLNSDGIGQPNYLDIDSDGDGITDNIEGQTTASYRLPAAADSDNDGLDNNYDLAPFAATFGGAGILLSDRDGDTVPDYIDLDTDADGQPDIVEGHDWNFDGIGNEVTTPLGTDADGDGLDDRFDLINSTTNVKGTSAYMGTSGSTTGDPSPGTRATVQRTLASGGCSFERDWRCVSVVLPIKYLQLNVAENNNSVTLNWGVISSLYLNAFEIERSTDNINYQQIGTQTADITLDQMTNFAGNDNIAGISSTVIYYRIKVIAVNGQVKYSNVVAVRKEKSAGIFTVHPNPANDVASVRFSAEKEGVVNITIRDFAGKLVYQQNVKALKGNNILPLTGLTRYSNGVYHVQVLIEEEIKTAKLVIQH